MKHDFAFRKLTSVDTELDLGGNYYFRINGERHTVNPMSVTKLQQAVRFSDKKSYKEYAQHLNNQTGGLNNLRGLMEFKKGTRNVPLEEVEPAKEIVKLKKVNLAPR